jgi:rhamnose transport system permease protein
VPADTTTPPATPGQDRRPLARRLLRWETALVVLLVVVGLVGEQTSPGFLTGGNLFYLGLDVGEIALLSLPLTMIIIAGEIDLSVASILGLTSALLGWLWNAGWALELIFPTVLVAGALAGALNGFLVTRLGLPSLAVTIGTLAMYRGLAFVILGDEAVADFPSSYTRYGTTPIPGTSIPYPIALFAVLAVVFGVVLHATPFGRSVFAIGANQEAAFFSGIRVRRTKFILFVLSGPWPGWAASSSPCASPAPGPTTGPAWSWPWWPPSCSAGSRSSAARGPWAGWWPPCSCSAGSAAP